MVSDLAVNGTLDSFMKSNEYKPTTDALRLVSLLHPCYVVAEHSAARGNSGGR
jgi:hypothetical protein